MGLSSFSVGKKWQLINADKAFIRLVFSRYLAVTVLVFLLQVVSMRLDQPLFTAPCSLALGTSVGFIFLKGTRVWLGMSGGSLLGYFLVYQQWYPSLVCASLQMGLVLSLYYVAHYLQLPTLLFVSWRALCNFFLSAGSLLALYSSLLRYCLPTLPPWSQLFFSALNGIAIFALAIVSLDAYFPDFSGWRRPQPWWLYFACLALVLVSVGLFFSPLMAGTLGMLVILLLSHYGGWPQVVLGFFLCGFTLVLGTYLFSSQPPFHLDLYLGFVIIFAYFYTLGKFSNDINNQTTTSAESKSA